LGQPIEWLGLDLMLNGASTYTSANTQETSQVFFQNAWSSS